MVTRIPRGIQLNRNALNIQQQNTLSNENNKPNSNNDNNLLLKNQHVTTNDQNSDALKSTVLSFNGKPLANLGENPDPKNLLKRLQLNFDKVNNQQQQQPPPPQQPQLTQTISDENAVTKLQPLTIQPDKQQSDENGARATLKLAFPLQAKQPPPPPAQEKKEPPPALRAIPTIKPQPPVKAASAPIPKFQSLLAIKQSSDEKVLPRQDENETVEDIDKSPSRDAVFLVGDIAKDIFTYMYQLETVQSVKNDYLKDQKIFTPKHRSRLINWCIDIHQDLRLIPETLYMTVSIIDRFFDKVEVAHQNQVQLVAAGATLIASKYEEIYPPEVADLLHLTNDVYSRKDLMRIEISILEQLDFDLGKPIPLAFLRRYSRAAHCSANMHSIAKYLMELSLSEYECSSWPPSLLAAAATFITVHLVQSENQPPVTRLPSYASLRRPFGVPAFAQPPLADKWSKTLVHYTKYTRQDLLAPAATLCKILRRAQKNPQFFACAKKYMSNLKAWPELKSNRVDELIKLGDQVA